MTSPAVLNKPPANTEVPPLKEGDSSLEQCSLFLPGNEDAPTATIQLCTVPRRNYQSWPTVANSASGRVGVSVPA